MSHIKATWLKTLITILCIMLITTTTYAETQMIITKNTKVYESMTTSARYNKVKKNMMVYLIRQQGAWGQIKNPKNNCIRYIQMKYLKYKNGLQVWAKLDTKILKSKNNKAKSIYNLTKGEKLTMLATDGTWASVTAPNGKNGYTKQENISQSKIDQSTPEDIPESTNTKTQQLVNYAKQFIGTPYKQNAKGPNAFDCSNFVAYCFKHFKISLSGALQSLAKTTKNMQKITNLSNCQAGDIMFFNSNEANDKLIDHAAINIGNNQIIHASYTANQVIISGITSFYQRTFVYALRSTKL